MKNQRLDIVMPILRLELAAGEVEKRFNHEDIRTIKEIETLLLKAGNGETVDSLSSLIQSYLKNDNA